MLPTITGGAQLTFVAVALPELVTLALTATAWLIFLYGLAQLILAAVHNQQGELGLGLESTLTGAKSCLASFLLAGIGLPQWVMASRSKGAPSRAPSTGKAS